MQIDQKRDHSLRMILEFENLEARAVVFWIVSNDDAIELWPLTAGLCDKRFNFLPNKVAEIGAVLDFYGE